VHTKVVTPEASTVKERSGIDPDLREQSFTKRFVPARALSFFGIKKSFDPSSFSHVTLSLQDSGIHIVSVELKFILFATHLQQCFGTESM